MNGADTHPCVPSAQIISELSSDGPRSRQDTRGRKTATPQAGPHTHFYSPFVSRRAKTSDSFEQWLFNQRFFGTFKEIRNFILDFFFLQINHFTNREKKRKEKKPNIAYQLYNQISRQVGKNADVRRRDGLGRHGGPGLKVAPLLSLSALTEKWSSLCLVRRGQLSFPACNRFVTHFNNWLKASCKVTKKCFWQHKCWFGLRKGEM